jgi:hypothetical protein
MMTLFLVLLLLLPSGLALWLFRNQFRREGQRQRSIRWPKAAAVFRQRFNRLPSAEGATEGQSVQYRPRFPEQYVFFAKGEHHSGEEIMPAPPSTIAPEHEQQLLESLAEHRVFYVRFNADNPAENYLSAGFAGLTWPRVLLYAYLVVGFPLLLWRVFEWVRWAYGDGETGRAIIMAFFGFAFVLVVLLYQLLFPRPSMRGLVEGVYPEKSSGRETSLESDQKEQEEMLSLPRLETIQEPFPQKRIA